MIADQSLHEPGIEKTTEAKDYGFKVGNWSVFLIFLKLGCTSFGGPVAHLSYFREEFVVKRRWLTDKSYADIVALCQFLPGPISSQVGMALGMLKGKFFGALAAWAGFTLPSAIFLILLAQGIETLGTTIPQGLLHGMKVVAVAVVCQAVWSMAKSLCPDRSRITIAISAACIALFLPNVWGQLAVIFAGALVGLLMFKPTLDNSSQTLPFNVSRLKGATFLLVFVALLIVPSLLEKLWDSESLKLFDSFYRSGSLVFGGGHVVLPLLQAEVVPSGWVSSESFLAGYGAAQAVPGPLFAFAAFLGATSSIGPGGWLGGAICLTAIFAPALLLIVGALPFWESIRHSAKTQSALLGINAAVVGLLLAALYNPVWTSAIGSSKDFGLALIAFLALMYWKMAPWLVLIVCGVASWSLSYF